jgi:hypothetical protein
LRRICRKGSSEYLSPWRMSLVVLGTLQHTVKVPSQYRFPRGYSALYGAVLPGLVHYAGDDSQGKVDRLFITELRSGAAKQFEPVITESFAHVHERLLQPRLS